ncbi:L-aspartate oxidase [Tsukamurella sp. 8F]|uniref:L-aspartate oxidase n=1 Tax=unclassified Tsukamurella TaxID=2633480 RepID=UPI0023BA2250|nr:MULTISPECIES: L-aspartate oxidase [unclassified Tsukamurella]MDF0529209.1 L-aspartate oxidase [Tsukamurella sp. 8J]MDF0585394.1 L-aspartate oxidase [Tsukamurella sp. 8F]
MTDLLVVGAGVGGLTAALAAVEAGRDVTVLCKPATDRGPATATAFAQGGVAVCAPDDPLLGDPGDSIELHVADTIAAGAGYVDEVAARSILTGGADAVRRLITWGARFDRDGTGLLSRTREGGHSARRIVHAGGDATGAEIQRALTAAARSGGVRVRRAVAQSLLLGPDGAALGVRTDCGDLRAGAVVLATGGAGHLYASTTNPLGATGDGIALAAAAGAEVSGVDFVQFHPTMLFTPGARGRRALVTEAVRGEGARLVAADGTSVTAGVHPLGDLAPRDVVSRAVQAAMERTDSPCVYLDARSIAGFARRFPTVTAAVSDAGIDPARDLVPVTPGAHYLCGGVVTGLDGATTVPGLYAVGEVACTGLHGANRLASNSLLEALVMGLRVASAAVSPAASAAAADSGPRPIADRIALQDLMTRYCGVNRTSSGLSRLTDLMDDPAFAPARIPTTLRDHEDAALTALARIVVHQARARPPAPTVGGRRVTDRAESKECA